VSEEECFIFLTALQTTHAPIRQPSTLSSSAMLAELFACEPKQCDACQPRKAQMSEDRAKTQTRMTDRHRALREAQTAQRMAKKQDPAGVRSMSESTRFGACSAPNVESPRVAPSAHMTESLVGPNGEAPTSIFQGFERRVERVGASGHHLCLQAHDLPTPSTDVQ